MNVAELIKELEKFPAEWPVIMKGNEVGTSYDIDIDHVLKYPEYKYVELS